MSSMKTMERQAAVGPVIKLEMRTDHAAATAMAKADGGVLPSLNEFMRLIKDPTQRELLKGDGSSVNSYWVRDRGGFRFTGNLKMDFRDGSLVRVSEREYEALPGDQKAKVTGGPGPIIVSMLSDRIDISARASPAALEDKATVAYIKRGREAQRLSKAMALFAKALRTDRIDTLDITLSDGKKIQIGAVTAPQLPTFASRSAEITSNVLQNAKEMAPKVAYHAAFEVTFILVGATAAAAIGVVGGALANSAGVDIVKSFGGLKVLVEYCAAAGGTLGAVVHPILTWAKHHVHE